MTDHLHPATKPPRMTRAGSALDGAPSWVLETPGVHYVWRVLPRYIDGLREGDRAIYKAAVALICRSYDGVLSPRVSTAVRSRANTEHGSYPDARTVALLAGDPPAVAACACVDSLEDGSLLVSSSL